MQAAVRPLVWPKWKSMRGTPGTEKNQDLTTAPRADVPREHCEYKKILEYKTNILVFLWADSTEFVLRKVCALSDKAEGASAEGGLDPGGLPLASRGLWPGGSSPVGQQAGQPLQSFSYFETLATRSTECLLKPGRKEYKLLSLKKKEKEPNILIFKV